MPRTTSVSRAVPGLLVALVASIVLGILGMHALSTPGTMSGVMSGADHDGHAATSSATGSDTPDQVQDPTGGTVAGTVATTVTVAAVDAAGEIADESAGSSPHGGHDMGGMVMLCAAMLAVAAVATLALLALGLRRAPRFWALISVPTTAPRWVTFRLGNRPPPVWEFSVIRC